MNNWNQAEIRHDASQIRKIAKLCTVTFDALVVTAMKLDRAGRNLS